MASSNFIVTSLPEFVKTNEKQILKNFALVGIATRKRIGLQTGVKSKEQLNYFEVAPELQDGKGCGFTPAGTVTLTARNIEVAILKVDMDICPKKLLGTYAEYLVKIAATENDLPFEQYIVDGVTAEINKKIENLIWQGDTTSLDSNLKWIDGFLKLANTETDTIKVNIAGGSAYEGLLQVYMALPEEALERGASIFVGPAIYRAFLQDIIGRNLFHFGGPADGQAPDEVYLPGTDVKVVKTPGLKGSLKVVATFDKNLVYGTDMEGDEEKVSIMYDEKAEEFALKVSWASGVQIALPNMVVLGTFAAAPTVAGGNAAALSSIATSAATLAGAVNENNQIETHPNE